MIVGKAPFDKFLESRPQPAGFDVEMLEDFSRASNHDSGAMPSMSNSTKTVGILADKWNISSGLEGIRTGQKAQARSRTWVMAFLREQKPEAI